MFLSLWELLNFSIYDFLPLFSLFFLSGMPIIQILAFINLSSKFITLHYSFFLLHFVKYNSLCSFALSAIHTLNHLPNMMLRFLFLLSFYYHKFCFLYSEYLCYSLVVPCSCFMFMYIPHFSSLNYIK